MYQCEVSLSDFGKQDLTLLGLDFWLTGRGFLYVWNQTFSSKLNMVVPTYFTDFSSIFIMAEIWYLIFDNLPNMHMNISFLIVLATS